MVIVNSQKECVHRGVEILYSWTGRRDRYKFIAWFSLNCVYMGICVSISVSLSPCLSLSLHYCFHLVLWKVKTFSLYCFLIEAFNKTFLSLFTILWNSAFSWIYLSHPPWPFSSLLFSAIWKANLEPLCLLAFLFIWHVFCPSFLHSATNFLNSHTINQI